MINNLLFEFTFDKEAKTVFITREFAAELSLVWDAFTKAEILDQWIAPAPFTAKTKHMNFVVGGKRFYAMVSPDGQENWALQKYISITPKTNFKIPEPHRPLNKACGYATVIVQVFGASRDHQHTSVYLSRRRTHNC